MPAARGRCESGGESARLAARLHAQCEANCWIDGPNRAWLAGVITDALARSHYRPDCGWETVRDLLGERADLPVVVSFSDSFPALWGSRFCGEAEPRWDALDAGERWRWGMAALHRRPQDQLEIRPDWAGYRFGHELSFADLLADDRTGRLERALSPGRPAA